MKKYDVAIIGAGTAGLSARKYVAKKTSNYAVIDNGILGTTCARVGCMPSKVLIQAANDFYRKNNFSHMGIHGVDALSVNHVEVMNHVRKLRDRFVKATMQGYEDWREKHLIQKRATFIDAHTLDLEGEKIHADKIIIATGSSPIIPESWLTFKKYLIDSNTFFELNDLPSSMAVIGLGVIGIELGQALHRLGINITAIGKKKSIAGLSDPEIIDYASHSFAQEMNIIQGGVKSLSEHQGKLRIHTDMLHYDVEKALVTVGRKPNLDSLNIEKAGIQLNQKGIPKFDPHTMCIENSSIFIAGDVNAEKTLLHEAADEGAIAGYNAVAEKITSFKRRTFIAITFTDPNIAIVGQSHIDLTNNMIDFVEGKVSFEGQGRAIIKLKEKGLLKIYACTHTAKILGAELYAPSGEHLAHLLAWSIQNKMSVFDMLSMPFYHPVIEEGLRTALRDITKKVSLERDPLEFILCHEHPTNAC